EWFIFISNLFKIDYGHPKPVLRYASSSHPFTTKQRDNYVSIFNFPYLLYDTIVVVLFSITVYYTHTDTTVLVGAFFVLSSRIKCIPIDFIPLVLLDSD